MRLPSERHAITHKFEIAGHEGYITVGLYDNGAPGELFVVISKQGSTISGLMDGFATSISIALQYGVPLEKLCEKFEHTRFEPSGLTQNADIRMAKSVLDYIFHWLRRRFLETDADKIKSANLELPKASVDDGTGPPCQTCGTTMLRHGTCYYCHNCGASTGCS